MCGVVYISPENSNFSHIDPYFEINEELRQFTERHDHVLLFGDFNLRIKLMKDYVEPDFTIFHENGLDEAFEEFQEELELFGNGNSCLR